VRALRICCAVAVLMGLSGCASLTASTETSIEQGEAKLMPETVVVGSDVPSIITAFVSIKGERRGIALLASECNDGVGSIRIIDEPGLRGIEQIYVFGSGDKPADRLFAALCEIRRRKMPQKPHTAP
jgi:hypothetical protein